jgi:DNA-binding beta-propeller fold protein YncE
MLSQLAGCLRLATAVVLWAAAVPVLADTVYVTSFTTGGLTSYDSADLAGTATVLLPEGSLVKPSALTVGPDGNLYIGENGDGSTFAPRISKLELASLTLSTVYPFGAFEVFPGSLVFQGNDLLIGRNPFFGNKGPIVRLANATGGPLAISDYTTGGSLDSSPGLALAPDGRLYVADQTYNFVSGVATGPVKRFDASGTSVGELIASGADGLAGPTGLAITADGTTLYTASIMNGTILQTDLGTDATTAFASAGGAFEVGTLALLADGRLLAGSPSGSGTIYRFDTDGTLISIFASGLGQIGGIATAVVPEPTALTLTAIGLAAAGWLSHRQRG